MMKYNICISIAWQVDPVLHDHCDSNCHYAYNIIFFLTSENASNWKAIKNHYLRPGSRLNHDY